MTNQPPRMHGFGIVANSQTPTADPIARKAATIAPKRPAREFDKTSPYFKPVWVQLADQRLLGYVVVLSYPTSTVNVPGTGVVEAENTQLVFITDVPGRNAAYLEMDLNDKPCAALIVVNAGANNQKKASA